jgi:ATP-dependent DNA helicase RecQ
VRLVVHLDLPDSPEAYFQEAGRAGRDGRKSFAVLLYDDYDLQILEDNFVKSFPDLSEMRRVYQALGSFFQLAVGAGIGESYNFDLLAFARTYRLEPAKTLSALKILEQAGWIALSEAVYIPGAFLIKVSREDLYDYQLKNQPLERILKAMLRTYTGAFQQHTPIREEQLARFLQMEKSALVKALQTFQREGIIDYRPARDAPQLTFLQERVDAAHLRIDREWYEFRKKRARERMEQMRNYVSSPVCRSRQLVGFFGENDAPLCGICDVCVAKKRARPSPNEFARLKDEIRTLLHARPLSEKELDTRMKGAAAETLSYLLDEGWVEERQGKLYWKDK